MEYKTKKILFTAILLLLYHVSFASEPEQKKIWEKVEIEFTSETKYENPYTDVEFWIQLTGPNFNKKIWGFWDGDRTFLIRFVATEPGDWSWISYANVDDTGLAGHSGQFTAIEWTKEEIAENPNRRGLIRTNPDAPHSFMYADGSPFFLLAQPLVSDDHC